ncbi:MAG: hypothetical protein ACRDZ3_20760 [Acidimicrobiia bacterium]
MTSPFGQIDMRRWGTKANIVALVRAKADESGVARLSSRELAEFFCRKQDWYARKLLAALVTDRVLVRVSDAAGPVARGWAFNFDVCRWEVPWREGITAELAAHRVDRLASRPDLTHKLRLVRRSVTDAQAESARRSVTDAQTNACASVVPTRNGNGSASVIDRRANSGCAPPICLITPPIKKKEKKRGFNASFKPSTARVGGSEENLSSSRSPRR